jgi:hypothetical protein
MLTEEALILLATLGASGMLILGVVELVWPSRPAQPANRRARVTATSQRDFETVAPIQEHLAYLASSSSEPATSEPGPIDATVSLVSPTEPIPVPAGKSAVTTSEMEPPETSPLLEGPAREPVHAELRPQVLPIEACLAMYNDGRFAEVVSLGSAALELHAEMAPVSNRPDEAAALMDLVGLSKKELGDRDGARTAFRAAIRGSEPRVRATYVRHLLALVRGVADPEIVSQDDDATRLRELRACTGVLDDVLSVVPEDEGARATQMMVRETLAAACERLVARVVSGDEDQEMRELVLETLTDHGMPAGWREKLREQFLSVSSAEIGQLTAQAIRSVQEGKDGDALAALERAERLSAALPSGAVVEERREEFERRLWWGYTKVGLRRIETGGFEGAMEPLFCALRLGGGDEERLAETRGALVRALEGVVDAGARTIRELGARDSRAAQAEIEKLAALVQRATERGIQPDELGDAFAKLTTLEQSLSESRA